MEVGAEGLLVGVEERGVDRKGVEDLTGGAASFEDDEVAREFGVEDREGLVDEGNVDRPVGVVDRPVGVVDLRVAAPDPLGVEGLLLPVLEEFSPDGNVGCLDVILFLEADSIWLFASRDFGADTRSLVTSV